MTDIDLLVPWQMTIDKTVLRGFHSKPSGKPVIHFLHGNGFSGLVYWPFLKHLTPHFDLFIGAVQGQGDSTSEEPFWGWNRHAFYTAQVWRHYQSMWPNSEHIAMGHSFGGVVSSLMLGDRRVAALHPNNFSQLITLDPVYFLPQMIGVMTLSDFFGFGSINKLAEITLKRTKEWPSREAALDSLSGKGMFKTWSPAAMQAYVDYALTENGEVTCLKCAPEMEAAVFGSFPKRLWSSIKKLSIPTIMIYGDKTYPFVSGAAKRLKKINKLAKIQRVSGSHCFMLENPEAAAKNVLTHLL